MKTNHETPPATPLSAGEHELVERLKKFAAYRKEEPYCQSGPTEEKLLTDAMLTARSASRPVGKEDRK